MSSLYTDEGHCDDGYSGEEPLPPTGPPPPKDEEDDMWPFWKLLIHIGLVLAGAVGWALWIWKVGFG